MRWRRADLTALTALLVSGALVGSASAQSAAISGRVVDEQGRSVPGATATLTNPRTGLTRTNASDAEGLYHFAGLSAGVYELRVSLNGFTTVEQPATTVDVGMARRGSP